MRKFTRNTFAAAAVVAATVSMTAAPASAATWSVSGGTSISGTNVGNLVARDLTTGAAASCDTGAAAGTAQNGTGLSGTGIAQLTSASFSDSTTPAGECVGPSGILLDITLNVSASNPWAFDAVSYSGGVTTGQLRGITASLHGSDECDATFTGPGGAPGTITGTYDNASGELTVNGGNIIVNTADADCDPGLIGQGDQIELVGTFSISPVLTITSP